MLLGKKEGPEKFIVWRPLGGIVQQIFFERVFIGQFAGVPFKRIGITANRYFVDYPLSAFTELTDYRGGATVG
jgi:hypothetical protein